MNVIRVDDDGRVVGIMSKDGSWEVKFPKPLSAMDITIYNQGDDGYRMVIEWEEYRQDRYGLPGKPPIARVAPLTG